MTKKYYPASEVLKILTTMGHNVEPHELASFARERIIRPVVYLDSLLAQACETKKQADGFISFCLGQCSLTAYWNISKHSEGLNFVNTLLRGESIQMESTIFKEDLECLPEIPLVSNWRYDMSLFKNVPVHRLQIEMLQEDANIGGFALLNKIKPHSLSISNSDFDLLKAHLMDIHINAKIEKENLFSKAKCKKRSKVAMESGKQSGQLRQQIAAQEWVKIRPAILKLSKDHSGKTPNKIATIAANNKHIINSQISNIAKKIRDDREIMKFLKKKR